METTSLREIHEEIPAGEVVVMATIIGDAVEFGIMVTGAGDIVTPDQTDPSLDMTVRELIDHTQIEGTPSPTPDSPLHNPGV